MNIQVNTTPDGYMKDARGRFVPVESIKPIDLERDALVKNIVEQAKALSAALAEFKAKTFGDIAALVELSAERYDVKLGGNKGNITLTSFDGKYRVLRSIGESLAFDEGILAAQAIMEECADDWTTESRKEVRAVINHAFGADKNGKLSISRIMDLRRMDIDDPRWLQAMNAISDSLRVQCSKPYVRVYERVGDTTNYRGIPLDIAGI